MTVLDFINRLLGREKPSGTMARQRLQLVLAHDRSDLNPELLDQMRREILEVVQRYVEIDIESCDVSLETEDRVTALLANLPIKRTREFPLPIGSGSGSGSGSGIGSGSGPAALALDRGTRTDTSAQRPAAGAETSALAGPSASLVPGTTEPGDPPAGIQP